MICSTAREMHLLPAYSQKIFSTLEDTMKTRFLILTFVLALAVVLAACSVSGQSANVPVEESASTSEETMDKESEATISDEMQDDEKSDEMMDDASEANMNEGEASDASMSDDNSNEMMDDEDGENMNDDGTMNNDNDDQNMNDGGEMNEDSGMMEAPDFFSASLVEVTSGEPFKIEDFKDRVVLVETMAVWCSVCLRQQREVVALHEMIGENDDFISLGLDIDPNENANDLRAYVANNGFNWIYAIAPVDVAREIGQLYGDQFLNPPSAPMFIIDRHGEVHLLPFGIKSAEQLYKAVGMYLEGGM